jgi:peptidyl-prolyl cis-trans isomerase B (cyclophilin B)
VPPSRRRERELARRRYERRMAARAEQRARARRRNQRLAAAVGVLAVIGLVVGLAVGLSGGPAKKAKVAAKATPSATVSPSPSPSQLPPGTCLYTRSSAGKVKFVGLPPETGVDHTTPYLMTMVTNRGTIKIDLETSKAPCTVNSFRFLAAKGYFNGTVCHRLTTARGLYVLQCGDPSGTGEGGPGYRFNDENLSGATYPAGTVAMANSGPNTNGSQFFLVYKASQLPPQYTPFGRIVSGLSVVQAVAKAGTDNSNGPGDGHPKLPVKIIRMLITKA